jgi:hypothetical protein
MWKLMKRRKNKNYDIEYFNDPLHTTIKRRPAFVKHLFFHRLFFVTWLLLGLLFLAMLISELARGVFFKFIMREISILVANTTGARSRDVYQFIVTYAAPYRHILMTCFGFLAFMFLLCAYYCSRLIKRSKYIIDLEEAALAANSFLLSEKRRDYQADN